MSMQRLALGTRKGLLLMERESDAAGAGWSIRHHAFRGSHVSIVFRDPRSGHLFACLDDGHFGNKLFRWNEFDQTPNWRDAGANDVWQELPTPAYPAGSKLNDGNDAILRYQWAMAGGSQQQPGRLYLGSEPGGLFVSDDHGDTFELVSSLWDHPSRTDKDLPWMGGGRDHAAIHSVVVDPRNHDCVWIGISVAGVFYSDDGLQTWRPANSGLRADFLPNPYPETGHDPHLLVQCPGQPDVLWQQNHCGIFRSTNGGMQWSDVSQPGGHCLVNVGDELVFATAGGSLYHSADRGESWQALARHLPPVYCVHTIDAL